MGRCKEVPASNIRKVAIRKWNKKKTPQLCKKKDVVLEDAVESIEISTVILLTKRLKELCQNLSDSGKGVLRQSKGDYCGITISSNGGSGGSHGVGYAEWRKSKGSASVEK